MQASTPIVDPIFAPGQVWQVTWREGYTVNLPVPARDMTPQSGANYEERRTNPNTGIGAVTSFRYDPVNADPEFIVVSTIFSLEKVLLNSQLCLVRNPGPVEIGTSLKGVFSEAPDKNVEAYIKTGVTDLPSCFLKRVK